MILPQQDDDEELYANSTSIKVSGGVSSTGPGAVHDPATRVVYDPATSSMSGTTGRQARGKVVLNVRYVVETRDRTPVQVSRGQLPGGQEGQQERVGLGETVSVSKRPQGSPLQGLHVKSSSAFTTPLHNVMKRILQGLLYGVDALLMAAFSLMRIQQGACLTNCSAGEWGCQRTACCT